MPLFRRLATLATAAEAARRYAKSNPDQAGRFLDQAAAFVDKQTKGKYRAQIDGVAKKAKGVAGIPTTTPPGQAPGYPPANGQAPGSYDGPTQAFGTPGQPTTPPKSH
ncbi:MAG: antitoxin [Pseudonocardiales bacterium]|jgi:hypothetical protein|nr:antitoxin [Pseudonocardiales bacterium]